MSEQLFEFGLGNGRENEIRQHVGFYFEQFLRGIDAVSLNILHVTLEFELLQKLRQIMEYCLKAEPQTSEKMDFNFVNNCIFIKGLRETA